MTTPTMITRRKAVNNLSYMNKAKNLMLLLLFTLLAACGNDEKVESQYVGKLTQAIELLDTASTIDEIVQAQEIEEDAMHIEGFEELQDAGRVKEINDKFAQALDSAQQRILDDLLK